MQSFRQIILLIYVFINNLGDCLVDEPPDTAYKFDEMSPGSMYDSDYQCNLLFPGSTHCETDPEKFCEKLFCRVEPKKCISNGEPPAEGTKCGAEKWCMRQKCVPLGEHPDGIAGGWDEWGDYGPCSRSCGGGIKISERTCTNPPPRNGGAYCLGEAKRFQICNTKLCPDDGKSFRAIQCAEFNKIPRSGRLHRWRPYTPPESEGGGDSSCVLYCINEEHTYSKLAPRAKDGTPCKRGANDMCVSGSCRRVGCDWVLDSVAINDKCGICNGDNSGCRKTSGVYTTGGNGYSKVVIFPKGARNIIVRERGPSDNTLAVANKEGEFYLNADNQEEIDGEKHFGKDLALYTHPEENLEELFIAGPLKKSLTLFVVFYEPKNVGVDYEYFIRDKNYKPARHTGKDGANKHLEDHHWEFVEWSKCSARCDGGEKKSEPSCISNCGDGVVSDAFCSMFEKPEPKTKVCNRTPCKVRWHTGEWGLCTGCEHQPGFQVRQVWCARESPRWDETDIITTEVECVTTDGTKPKTKQLCTSPCPPNCRRSTRSSSEKRSSGKMDKNFFNEYYQEVDMLAFEPEGLLFGMLTGWDKDSPDSPRKDMERAFIGSKPMKCQAEGTPAIDPSQLIPDEIKKGLEANLHTDSKSCRKKKCGKVKCNKCPKLDIPLPSKFLNLPRVEESNRPESNLFVFPKKCPSSICGKPAKIDKRMDSTVTKQCHPVAVDKVDKNDLVLIEAPYLPPNNNLSDAAFEKLGDKESGTLDVQHEKVFHGDEAICAINAQKNLGITDHPPEEDATEKDVADY